MDSLPVATPLNMNTSPAPSSHQLSVVPQRMGPCEPLPPGMLILFVWCRAGHVQVNRAAVHSWVPQPCPDRKTAPHSRNPQALLSLPAFQSFFHNVLEPSEHGWVETEVLFSVEHLVTYPRHADREGISALTAAHHKSKFFWLNLRVG